MKYREIELNGEKCLLKKQGKITLTVKFSKEKTDGIIEYVQNSLTELFEERIRGETNEESICITWNLHQFYTKNNPLSLG